jgi:hypothetical protein
MTQPFELHTLFSDRSLKFWDEGALMEGGFVVFLSDWGGTSVNFYPEEGRCEHISWAYTADFDSFLQRLTWPFIELTRAEREVLLRHVCPD